jgi:CBS domain-containing protein
MRTAKSIEEKRGIHMIESTASVEDAREMMEEQGVLWLVLCRADIIVGIIDMMRLKSVPRETNLSIEVFAEGNKGYPYWIV